jgi:hypothetical protein
VLPSVDVRWSELSRERLLIELAKLGISTETLVLDIQDVPELHELCEELHSDEERLRLALVWFGDDGHPQPRERQRWVHGWALGDPDLPDALFQTPDWGRLPRLTDGATVAGYELLNGPLGEGLEVDPTSDPEPLSRALFDDVTRRLDGGDAYTLIERETGLSHRQVSKIRDYDHHPNELGPKDGKGRERPGYALYRVLSAPGQIPEVVALRKLRRIPAG